MPYQGLEACAIAARGALGVVPMTTKSLGGERSLSPWDIHTWNSGGRELKRASMCCEEDEL